MRSLEFWRDLKKSLYLQRLVDGHACHHAAYDHQARGNPRKVPDRCPIRCRFRAIFRHISFCRCRHFCAGFL